MKYLKTKLIRLLVNYFDHDDQRIEHALCVLSHAERIMLGYPDCDTDIVIASAILHDVGIKIAEEKHGYNTGKTQEEYGPPVAAELLNLIDFPHEKTIIVQEIIGNHHSPSRYDYPELEILKAADLIVNENARNHDSNKSNEY